MNIFQVNYTHPPLIFKNERRIIIIQELITKRETVVVFTFNHLNVTNVPFLFYIILYLFSIRRILCTAADLNIRITHRDDCIDINIVLNYFI